MPAIWLAENSQIRFLVLIKSNFRASALTEEKKLLLIAVIKTKPNYIALIISSA